MSYGDLSAGDLIQASVLSAKTICIQSSAPTPSPGKHWFDLTNRVLWWYDNVAGYWRGGRSYGTATTSSNGYVWVSFPFTYSTSPFIRVEVLGSWDGRVQITSRSTTGFAIQTRVLNTGTFVTGGGTGTAVTAVGNFNVGNAVTAVGSLNTATGIANIGTTTGVESADSSASYVASVTTRYAAGSSSGDTTYAFSAYTLGLQTVPAASHSHTLQNISTASFVISKNADSTDTFLKGKSADSTGSFYNSLYTGTAVVGWANGGSCSIMWEAWL